MVSNDGRKVSFAGSALPPSPISPASVRRYVINADGSGLHEVLANAEKAYNFAFSPDGTRLAFEQTRNGNSDIYVVNTDGTHERRLTTDPGHDELPAWSPDGTRTLFQSNRGGHRGIYMVNADGTGERRIR